MSAAYRHVLIALALTAGIGAAVLQDPLPPLASDEVSAVQLAEWLRAKRPGLQLLDLRPAGASAQAHLPGSRLAADIEFSRVSDGDIVVVYADRGVDHATAQAVQPRAGRARLLRLRDGMHAWSQDVLHPVLRSDASARQQHAFVYRAQLSRYFGGTPRVLESGALQQTHRGRGGC